MKKISPLLLLLSLLMWSCGPVDLNSPIAKAGLSTTMTADEEGVYQAAMDYLNGLYQVDTSLIYRSVHPDLKKRGYWFNKKKEAYAGPSEMTFQQLVDLTKRWNKDGSNAGKDAVKKVTIFEVLDKTATAKVTAVWGTDYMHLAKEGDKWIIMNILWQSPPPNS